MPDVVQYIIGQLNAPVSQFITFVQSTQDVKISLERLDGIYGKEDEEPVCDDVLDMQRVGKAVETANIGDFIDSLPLGYHTKIGMEGHGLSTGQKQRLLIARAAYKDAKYLIFDKATNSLDANNERFIMERLNLLFRNRTVVIVAHRLSTVRNADNIVVIDKGKITEHGTIFLKERIIECGIWEPYMPSFSL